jgi:hypothetical protein
MDAEIPGKMLHAEGRDRQSRGTEALGMARPGGNIVRAFRGWGRINRIISKRYAYSLQK